MSKKKTDFISNEVEVLLATYNGEDFVLELLNSLIDQTYQNFTITVRDDGSTDNTIKIIKKFQAMHVDKVFLLEDSLGNIGSSKSFMEMLKYSNGKYIMFCDQDDVWMCDKIQKTFKKMKSLEREYTTKLPLMVFTDLVVVDKNLKIISSSYWSYQYLNPVYSYNFHQIAALNVVTGCTVMINKSAKDVVLPFSCDILHDHWVGVAIAKYGKVDYINDKTVYYRQHGKNLQGALKITFKYLLLKQLFFLKNYKKITCMCDSFKISLIGLLYRKYLFSMKRFFR